MSAEPTHHIVAVEDPVARAQTEALSNMVPEMVKTAVAESFSHGLLSTEEREWVRLACKREARREKFQLAVIEKSLAGLVIAIVLGVGAWVLIAIGERLDAHGFTGTRK